jgi:hypothetical protein
VSTHIEHLLVSSAIHEWKRKGTERARSHEPGWIIGRDGLGLDTGRTIDTKLAAFGRSISVGVEILHCLIDWAARAKHHGHLLFWEGLLHYACDLIANSALFKRVFKGDFFTTIVLSKCYQNKLT